MIFPGKKEKRKKVGSLFSFFPIFLRKKGKKEKTGFTFFLFSFFPQEKRKKGKKWVHVFPRKKVNTLQNCQLIFIREITIFLFKWSIS